MLQDWLSRLSKREGALLALAIFALIFSATFALSRAFYESRSSSYLHSIIKIQEQIDTLSALVDNAKAQKEEFERIEVGLIQLGQRRAQLYNAIAPLKLNPSEATALISQIAQKSGVLLLNLGIDDYQSNEMQFDEFISQDKPKQKPDGKAQDTPSELLSIKFSVIAKFAQMMLFLSHLEEKLFVDSVAINKSGQNLQGDFEILVLMPNTAP